MHRGFGAQIRRTFRLRSLKSGSLVAVERLRSAEAVPPIPAALVQPTREIESAQPCCLFERVPPLVQRCQNTSTFPKSSDRPPKLGSLPRTGDRCSRLLLTLVPSCPALTCQCKGHSVHVETLPPPLLSKSA